MSVLVKSSCGTRAASGSDLCLCLQAVADIVLPVNAPPAAVCGTPN